MCSWPSSSSLQFRPAISRAFPCIQSHVIYTYSPIYLHSSDISFRLRLSFRPVPFFYGLSRGSGLLPWQQGFDKEPRHEYTFKSDCLSWAYPGVVIGGAITYKEIFLHFNLLIFSLALALFLFSHFSWHLRVIYFYLFLIPYTFCFFFLDTWIWSWFPFWFFFSFLGIKESDQWAYWFPVYTIFLFFLGEGSMPLQRKIWMNEWELHELSGMHTSSLVSSIVSSKLSFEFTIQKLANSIHILYLKPLWDLNPKARTILKKWWPFLIPNWLPRYDLI